MPISVLIPTPLRKLTAGEATVSVEADRASTVAELITTLESSHPGIRKNLCDDSGEIRRFINIFVNDEDIRFLQKSDTPVKEGDQVSIVPAIAGGAC